MWRIFVRLHRRRGASALGVSRITWADIDAFSRLNRRSLAPWEIDAIERCDDAFMAAQSARPAE